MSWWDVSLRIRGVQERCGVAVPRGGGRRTYAAVAADIGVTGETLRSWVRQADGQDGRADGSRSEPSGVSRDEELARLRAENGRLRKAERERELEREILRRAAQYFAAEMRA